MPTPSPPTHSRVTESKEAYIFRKKMDFPKKKKKRIPLQQILPLPLQLAKYSRMYELQIGWFCKTSSNIIKKKWEPKAKNNAKMLNIFAI